MTKPHSRPIRFSIWKLFKLPPRLLYALGLGRWYGRVVLLLTTTGRVSGKPRITPLQYEEIEGKFYVASARGEQADWYRNILVNPLVKVRVGEREFEGQAETITDPQRVADFLEIRLQRHPRFVGAIMRLAGAPPNPQQEDLVIYARNRALVIIRPLQSGAKSEI